MAQGVKVVAAKPEDLSLTHGGGTDRPDAVYGSIVSTPSHVHITYT